MPSNIVKSFADKTGKSIEEVESLWQKAKEIASEKFEEDDDRFYPMVTGILKKMLNLKESFEEKMVRFLRES